MQMQCSCQDGSLTSKPGICRLSDALKCSVHIAAYTAGATVISTPVFPLLKPLALSCISAATYAACKACTAWKLR